MQCLASMDLSFRRRLKVVRCQQLRMIGMYVQCLYPLGFLDAHYLVQRPSLPPLGQPSSRTTPPTLPPLKGIGCDGSTYNVMSILAEKAETPLIAFGDWKYENRRQAQAILSYLYLGPASASKDLDFLKRKCITMILVVRDTTMAIAKFMTAEKTAALLNIEAQTIDVEGSQQLIAAFPRVNELINRHLVSIHQKEIERTADLHYNNANDGATSAGKVLVVCETGNER